MRGLFSRVIPAIALLVSTSTLALGRGHPEVVPEGTQANKQTSQSSSPRPELIATISHVDASKVVFLDGGKKILSVGFSRLNTWDRKWVNSVKLSDLSSGNAQLLKEIQGESQNDLRRLFVAKDAKHFNVVWSDKKRFFVSMHDLQGDRVGWGYPEALGTDSELIQASSDGILLSFHEADQVRTFSLNSRETQKLKPAPGRYFLNSWLTSNDQIVALEGMPSQACSIENAIEATLVNKATQSEISVGCLFGDGSDSSMSARYALSPNGRFLLIHKYNQLSAYDLSRPLVEPRTLALDSQISTFTFSETGEKVVIGLIKGSNDQSLALDLSDPSSIKQQTLYFGPNATNVFLKDGRLLSLWFGKLIITDFSRPSRSRTYELGTYPSAAHLSSDGRRVYLAYFVPSQVEVWTLDL